MGSDLTPVEGLSGILIPWALTLSARIGGGYDCADVRPGPFTPSARTPLQIEASMPPGVAFPSDLTQLDVQAIRSGAAGATRSTSGVGPAAGIAYRVNNTGDWYGHDDYHVQTGGVRRVVAESGLVPGISRPSMVALDSGKVVACYSTPLATYAAVRDADGVWSTGKTVTGGNVGALATLCMAPDGALHIYAARPTSGAVSPRWVIACYRSVDEGETWIPATYDIGKTSVSNGDFGDWNGLRAASVNGAVALWINTSPGGTHKLQQWVSTDGGYAFRRVFDETNSYTVLDAQPAYGTIHVLTVEDGNELRFRALGNPAGSLLSTGYKPVTATSTHHTDTGAICVAPDGAIYVVCANESLPVDGLDAYRSTDRGLHWNDAGPNYTASNAADALRCPALAISRGTMVGLVCDATTVRGMYELCWGGNTNATIGSQVSGRTSELKSWIPVDTLQGSGWTPTAIGTPTTSLDVDGNGRASMKIVTGVGDQLTLASPTDSSSDGAVQSVVARISSGGGTAITMVFLADDQSTTVKLTATGIVAYDTGGTVPSYTSHGGATSDYFEVMCISDAAHSRSIVAWRILDTSAQRTFSTLSAVTGQTSTGGGAIGVTIHVGVSTTAYVMRVTRAKADTLTLGEGWESPIARPYSLDPVPLSLAQAHIYGGLDVTMTAGVAAVDLVTQTMYPESTRRASNMLPTVAPSPRAVWRSKTTDDQVFTFALPQHDRHGLIGIYLDGLVGIAAIEVTCGLSPELVTLAATLRYRDLGGGAVVPSTTGSTTQRPWVRADELAGAYFKDATGNVRKVLGNSEGSLTYGSTIAEQRAVLYLDDVLDGATNGTGTLYPARALILGHLAGDGTDDIDTITLSILAADNTDVGNYREIGVMAAGRVHVIGETPDLGDTLAAESSADVQTLQDGQRYTARAHADRRVVEIALADSIHEARQMFGTATSPDYVIATTGKRPVGSRTGVPLVVEGIIRRAANTSNGLCVWVPNSVKRASVGWYAKTLNLDGMIYGRITSSFRREAVANVGWRGSTQAFRTPTIRFEEEL